MENFERRKQDLLALFAEQSLKDSGFVAFKDSLAAFDDSLDQLKERRLNSENPGMVFGRLNEKSEALETIKKEAGRFKKALGVVADLEFRIDVNISENAMSVKFGNEGWDLDLHERIRQALKTDSRPRMIRNTSVDPPSEPNLLISRGSIERGSIDRGSIEKGGRRSFLDFSALERQTTNNANKKRETLANRPFKSQLSINTPTGGKETLLSANAELEEIRQFHPVSQQQKSADLMNWDESEIILDDLDSPPVRPPISLHPRATSTQESSENLIRKLTSTEAPQPRLTHRGPALGEGLTIKPSQGKFYFSQRKIQLDVLPSSTVESNRAQVLAPINVTETGVISNQAIDETKFKLILSELKASQRHFSAVEFINNTFKCNYPKVLKAHILDKMNCEVRIDEGKNKVQFKQRLTKKELDAFKSMNVFITQV